MPVEAVIVEVAQALVVELTGAGLSQSFTPELSYADWSYELPDLGTLHVDIVPADTLADIDVEAAGEFAVTVDVLIRQRFAIADQESSTGRIATADINALMLLVEEVWRKLRPDPGASTGRLTTPGGLSAVWDPDPRRTRFVQHFVRQHLRQLGQFTGWLRFGYLVDL